MSVVGSYEISLEDEYDPVGIPIVAEYPWLLPLILVMVIILVGVGVYAYKRMKR